MLEFVGEEKGLVGIPGIPSRDIDHEELRKNRKEWATLLGCKPQQVKKLLVRSGAYRDVKDEPKEEPKGPDLDEVIT